MEIKLIVEKKNWEKFILSQHPNAFLQSWNWGEVHQQLGKKVFRLGLFEGKTMVGAAQLIKEEARRGTYLIIPSGPILVNWQEKYLSCLVEAIKKIGQEERAIFVRVGPNLENKEQNRELFAKLGFRRAPMYLHAQSTIQLNLNLSREELLTQMRKSTRYEIRRSSRVGLETSCSKEIKDIKILYRLQLETLARHHFVPFSQEFFEKHFQVFLKDEQIVLIKALQQKQVLAIGMFVFYGDTAVYHYSGSSSKYPKMPSTYAMLWHAILEAKKRDCRIFDLWGIAPDNSPRHRFAGVTLFKKGFGGQRIDYLHAQDLVLNPFYWLTFAFETIRRWQRRV